MRRTGPEARKGVGAAGLALAAVVVLLTPAPARAAFPDVPPGHWARSAIRYVAEDRDWMRDYGEAEFRPSAPLARRHLARALVLAFAPQDPVDPDVVFTDLPPDDPHYPFANVAVARGWLGAKDGAFRPAGKVKVRALDGAIVRALGLGAELAGLDAIATEDGVSLRRPPGFAALVLARNLRLHPNHPTDQEARELRPSQPVTRAYAAWALRRAHLVATAETWRLAAVARFRTIVLPAMNDARRRAVEHAFRFVGYPYVYAGEWHEPTPPGYCCGAQAQGGFDCSGFVWWVLRAPGGGWDNTRYRPYAGWPLPERSSRDMARATTRRLGWARMKPMDVMLFDPSGGSGWEGVSHAGLWLGNGWLIDSGNGQAGVTINWAQTGWYRDSFVWARRVIR